METEAEGTNERDDKRPNVGVEEGGHEESRTSPEGGAVKSSSSIRAKRRPLGELLKDEVIVNLVKRQEWD